MLYVADDFTQLVVNKIDHHVLYCWKFDGNVSRYPAWSGLHKRGHSVAAGRGTNRQLAVVADGLALCVSVLRVTPRVSERANHTNSKKKHTGNFFTIRNSNLFFKTTELNLEPSIFFLNSLGKSFEYCMKRESYSTIVGNIVW